MSDNEEASHLSSLSDGAGCTEIWEHLSEQRAAAEAEQEREDDDDEDAETVDAKESTEDTPEKEAAGVPCP